MQKLGKANETKDLTFDEFVTNFNKQQVGERAVIKSGIVIEIHVLAVGN